MSNLEKTVEEVATETTAIISILRETRRKSDPGFRDDEIIYSIHLSFVGATILPPFLPCMKDTATKKRRNAILKELKEVSDMYIESYLDLKLTPQEGKRIKSAIEALGESIAGYLYNFTQILKVIAKMNVKNIIIHTDDFAIPWTWAYYPLDIENVQHEGPVMDFLCNRYPCGILIVDTQEGSLSRLRKFWDDIVKRSTDKELLNKFEVSLFQGVLPGDKKSKNGAKGQYLKNLETILQKRFEKENVHTFTFDDWRPYSGDSDKFVDRFLAGNIKGAKIVHYLGHVKNGALKFDEDTSTYPNDLKGCLYYFRQNPLVVLHGCSSGMIVDLDRKDKQLPTVFLERGASGCVVALLPVVVPIRQETGAETMMDIFYRKVVVDIKPYGQALFEARQEFQDQEETKHDPQWLFFQFYGDPRAMLITTSGKGHLRRYEYFWELMEQEERTVSHRDEKRIGFIYDEDLINAEEIWSELKANMYPNLEMTTPSIPLGDPSLFDWVVSPQAISVYEFIGKAFVAAIIADIINVLKKQLSKKNKEIKEIPLSEYKSKKANKENVNVVAVGDLSNKSSGLYLYEIVDSLLTKKTGTKSC